MKPLCTIAHGGHPSLDGFDGAGGIVSQLVQQQLLESSLAHVGDVIFLIPADNLNRKWVQLALLGLAFVAIGAVGIVVPGLPTTPLLLLAAACFARSSPRLYAWLLRNPTFGPLIEDFRAGRGVSARVKVTALTMMTAFVAFALLVPLRERPLPSTVVAVVAVIGAGYILRLPTRRA